MPTAGFHAMSGTRQAAQIAAVGGALPASSAQPRSGRPPDEPPLGGDATDDDGNPIPRLDDQIPDQDLSLARQIMPEHEKRFDTEKRRRRRGKVIEEAKHVFDTEEFAKLDEEVKECSHHVDEQINPLTAKTRDYVIYYVKEYFRLKAPRVAQANIWHISSIMDHFKAFLKWKVMTTRGKSENKRMSSRSLKCFTNVYIQVILKLAHNDDMEPMGLKVLSHNKLYNKIENRYKGLVKELKLNRGYVGERTYISLPEVKLLIEECLKLSTQNGRAPRIRLIVVILLTYFFLFRPSTLGPAHPEYAKQGFFPKLGDILSIIQVGPCQWKIVIIMRNFKGYNGEIAQEMKYTLTSVTMCHNVLYCPCMWLLLYLITRGALVGIDTVEDLIANTQSQIYIKPEMKDKPLFVTVGNGSKEVGKDEPMTANALERAFHDVAKSAGLINVSLYSLRRMGSTEIAIIYNADTAAFALTHSQRHVASFLRHYFMGMSAIDLVNARLLEYFTDGHTEENVRARIHALDETRAAAINMLCRTKYEDYVAQGVVSTESLRSQPKGSMVVKRKPEDEAAIQQLDEVKKLKDEAARQWPALRAYFDVSRCRDTTLPKAPDGNGVRGIKQRKNVVYDKESAEFKRLDKAYSDIWKKVTVVFQRHRREADEAERRAVMKGLQETANTTVEGRQEIVEQFRNPQQGEFVVDAVRDHQDSIAAAANEGSSGPGAGPSTSSNAHASSSKSAVPQPGPSARDQLQPDDSIASDEDFDACAEVMKFPDLRKNLKYANILEGTLCEDSDKEDEDEDNDSNDAGLPETSRVLEKENDEDQMKGLDLPYLIACTLRYAAKPFHDEQLITRYCQSLGNIFKCPTCANLPGERRGKTRDRAFPDRGKLNRHLKEDHTKWLDLALEMKTEFPDIFVCPSGDFMGKSVSAVRLHCLSTHCVDQEVYLGLLRDTGADPSHFSFADIDEAANANLHSSMELFADKAEEELDKFASRIRPSDGVLVDEVPEFVYQGSEHGIDFKDDDAMEEHWAAHPGRYKVMTAQSLGDGSWSAADVLQELQRVGKRASSQVSEALEVLWPAFTRAAQSGIWETCTSETQSQEITKALQERIRDM